MKNLLLFSFALLGAGCSYSAKKELPSISINTSTGIPLQSPGDRPYYELERYSEEIIKADHPSTVREAEYALSAAWHFAPAYYAHKALSLTAHFKSPILNYYRAKFASSGFGMPFDREKALSLFKIAANEGIQRAQLDYVDLLIQDRKELPRAITYLTASADTINIEVKARILYFNYLKNPSESLRIEIKNIANAGGRYAKFIQSRFLLKDGQIDPALVMLNSINDFNNADLMLTLADLNEAIGNNLDAKIYFYACARRGDLMGLKRLAEIFEKEQNYDEATLLYSILYYRDNSDENKTLLTRASSKLNKADEKLISAIRSSIESFSYNNKELNALLLQKMLSFN